MDSHEARELLRSSPWVGYSQDERMAMSMLLCDVHEWMEEAHQKRQEQEEFLADVDAVFDPKE